MMMKRKFLLESTLCAWVLLSVNSCKPDLKEIGPEYAPGEGIYGTWQTEKIQLTDLSPALPEIKDVSGFYQADAARKLVIRFDKTGNTYSVIQAGYLPRIFGSSGTWKFDTIPYPSTLFLMTDKGDTLRAPLKNMPRETDRIFGFTYTRSDTCGKAYLTYDFTFSRQ